MRKKLLYRSASDVDDAGSDLAKMVSEIHKELEIETENAKELEVILLTGNFLIICKTTSILNI